MLYIKAILPCCKVDRECRGSRFSNRSRNNRENGPDTPDPSRYEACKSDFWAPDVAAILGATYGPPLRWRCQISPSTARQSAEKQRHILSYFVLRTPK